MICNPTWRTSNSKIGPFSTPICITLEKVSQRAPLPHTPPRDSAQYWYVLLFTPTPRGPRALRLTAAARIQTATFCWVIGTLCPGQVFYRRRSCISVLMVGSDPSFHLQVVLIVQSNAIMAQSPVICLFVEVGKLQRQTFLINPNSICDQFHSDIDLERPELTLAGMFQGGKLGCVYVTTCQRHRLV